MPGPIIPVSPRDAAFLVDFLRAMLAAMEAAPHLYNTAAYKRLHDVASRLNARHAAVAPRRSRSGGRKRDKIAASLEAAKVDAPGLNDSVSDI